MTHKPSRNLKYEKKPYCLLVFEVICVRLFSIFPLVATSKFINAIKTLIGQENYPQVRVGANEAETRNMKEFNYQWENIPSSNIEYTEERVNELLAFTKLQPSFFEGKLCLDAGCGNGRYTYALRQLGAKVVSFDISEEAIKACREVNPDAYVYDLLRLASNPMYDFVLCWGVLHHLPDSLEGFKKVASQVKPGGILHIMVYHKETQKIYKEGRRIWHNLNDKDKLILCRRMIQKYGGDLHGWWDAFNPKYNWSYDAEEIRKWFEKEEFTDITLTVKHNINMKGRKR